MSKRKIRFVAVLLACMLLFGLASSVLAFGPGARGPDVSAVQAMLKSMGYYRGSVDGVFGGVTAASVKWFQRDVGLTATGQVDSGTMRSILSYYTKAKLGGAGKATSGGGTGAGGGTVGGTAGYKLSQSELQMIALVNQARQAAGLPALSIHTELARVARYKSSDMVKNAYFSHDSPTYGSPFQMMTDFGVRYTAAGENIACNQTVSRAHEALMNSPGHRANILSTDFTHIGIGISAGGKCGEMYTQMFLKP